MASFMVIKVAISRKSIEIGEFCGVEIKKEARVRFFEVGKDGFEPPKA